jgi:CRISPR-associated protein Cas2
LEQHYVIAYDIRDPTRLRRVAKVMEDFGERVQKSVFEAALSTSQVLKLKNRLRQEMDCEVDGVKFFPLCPKCDQRVNIIGAGETTDLFQEVVIV